MKIANFFREQLIRLQSGLRGGVKPELEAVYQSIFDRDLATLAISNEFYPLNAAANYSLLYLVLRAAKELDVRNIVELGAGQTTLLLESLRRKGVLKPNSVLTIEHDETWSSLVGAKVSHEIQRVPIVKGQMAGLEYDGYDLSQVAFPSAKIDFLLVDGPLGWGHGRTFARLGALPLLERLDFENGFLIIVDDAEREGERALAAHIESRLRNLGVNFLQGQTIALKRQIVFSSGNMAPAAFF